MPSASDQRMRSVQPLKEQLCLTGLYRPMRSAILRHTVCGTQCLRVALRLPMLPLAPRRLSTAAHGVASPPASQHNVEVDVCIVGGGIVGSCVAAALKRASRTCGSSFTVAHLILSPLPRRHLRIALVDSFWPTRLDPSSESSGHEDHAPARDRRVYAISPASRQLLQAVGAWELLSAESVHDYDSMQVPPASSSRHV